MNIVNKYSNIIVEEYKSVRAEILQLNGQIFGTLSTSLSLNIAILGWFYASSHATDYYGLPTLGILVLFLGNIILLNRNRLSHRLSYFQKYFIETRLPCIVWSRVYLAYRDIYANRGVAKFSERLADSGTYILISSGIINVLIIVIYYIEMSLNRSDFCFGYSHIANISISIFLIFGMIYIKNIFTDYSEIEKTFSLLAEDNGLI